MLFRAQALLIDIDGTLVDSTAAVVASRTTWATVHGLDAGEILRVCSVELQAGQLVLTAD